jgi:hypothetical protein
MALIRTQHVMIPAQRPQLLELVAPPLAADDMIDVRRGERDGMLALRILAEATVALPDLRP